MANGGSKPSFKETNDVTAVIACVTPWVFALILIYLNGEVPLWLKVILSMESMTATVWLFGKSAFSAAKEVAMNANSGN